ncbi:uncharacterized protein LOC120355231 [Nilaparvata lugens]|uniref:uncharacterized protein LOC120355230 n=1 Tax=Nilaparvata lugens TaxID=108931 RepID=UPI00193DF376|nr:uncharacterized protein LOC120355230 [Nilaparvata lugens]XP_039299505.1 uncharacterized protein LOC120355231 [Nilaparvata lugens]XP_039299506.1 uncharacterized protein LOC120355231 [Nilaparvata lugens]
MGWTNVALVTTSSVLLSSLVFVTAASKNPTYFNIGGVLSNNVSEFHFQETIAHVNFDSHYVPRGTTYYVTAIQMDANPIRTALSVCKYLIAHRSIVLYDLTLWGGATDVSRVLLIQKRALRILCGAEHLAHCRPLFVRERILIVVSLYVLQTLCRTHANVGELVTRQNFHSHETRGRQRLDEPYQRLSRTRSSYGHLSVRLFNKLPVMARNLPASKFRRVLRDLLLDNPLYSLREFFMLDSSLSQTAVFQTM